MIAEPIVYGVRLLKRSSFTSIKAFYCNCQYSWGTIQPISSLISNKQENTPSQQLAADELAAILFTSGGTGRPKGVEYTHRIFSTQTALLKQLFSLKPTDIDIPGFPLFSLFAINMGMTSCPPPMNPSKPAHANAKKLVDWIIRHQGTFVAGSPAIWEKVADYCLKTKQQLPSIRYLVMFGAPVSIGLHQKFSSILTHGTTYTPYGATECLPVSCISGKAVLSETAVLSQQGHGTCVGEVVPSVEVKIIRPSKDAIPDLREAEILENGSIGEIIVSGPIVTARYFQSAKETARTKIYQPTDSGAIKLWHRIGDMGYLDRDKRLWFCGRVSHAININGQDHYSIPCEAIFNQHPEVKRSALIELNCKKQQCLGIVIERKDKKILKGKRKIQFESELTILAKSFPHTSSIDSFFYAKTFPVDVRHNIKIDRLKLRDIYNHQLRKNKK